MLCPNLKAHKPQITPTSPKDDIMWLQHRLNESISAGLVVDGIYGKGTAEAVRKYYTFKRWERDDAFTGLYAGLGTIKSLT